MKRQATEKIKRLICIAGVYAFLNAGNCFAVPLSEALIALEEDPVRALAVVASAPKEMKGIAKGSVLMCTPQSVINAQIYKLAEEICGGKPGGQFDINCEDAGPEDCDFPESCSCDVGTLTKCDWEVPCD